MHIDWELDRSSFGYRREEGQHLDGCGIICEDLLIDILGFKAARARGHFKFRVQIPRYGVYKGIMTKRKISAIDEKKRILLPPFLYPLDDVEDSEKMMFSIEVC